jgi:hypothetical protein
MRSIPRFVSLLAIALFAFAGCSDDSTAPNDTQSAGGLMQGEIGDADFTITLAATGEGEQGPFVLTGTNLEYIDSLQTLAVDLIIRNDGDVAHVLPVGLTFVDLIPSDVTVANPDNGVGGDGAAIQFQFANDDMQWTPGESSLPRNVRFNVAEGTSIGFAARLDVGEPLDGGAIAGRVWNDANENGVIDSGEEGVSGVEVSLNGGGEDDSTNADDTATTDENGDYEFDGLTGGVYTVSIDSTVNDTTTPSALTVLLVESDEGVVSDFLDANFGVLDDGSGGGGGDDDFPVGAYVEVNGQFNDDHLVAMGVDLKRCDDDDDDDDDDKDDSASLDGGHDGDRDEVDCDEGKLRGPVTDIDEENDMFAVMGVWLTANELPEGLDVGDRVDVRLHVDGDDLVVDRVKEWHNPHFEQVHGRVESIESDDDSIRATILGLEVVVMRPRHAASR